MIRFAILLAFLTPASPAARGAGAQDPILLVRFRADAVDGVDELVVRGREASLEHYEWDPMQGVEIDVAAPLPDSARDRIVVRAKVGRSTVTIVQLPSAENGRELRVRVDDGPQPGAAPLAFELWALPDAGPPLDVLVVTIDSLRPDRLGVYGHDRPTSPNLDAFAADAVRFTNAFSTSSFTPPAHGSLLTSRQVGDHGLLTWNALPDEQVTLAEVLAARGWLTGASVNLTLLSDNGLGQGVAWQREGQREARRIVDDALEFIRGAGQEPWFLWLHLYDVHRPYGRVPGWAERFAPRTRAGVGDAEGHYNLRPDDVRERGLLPDDLAWIVDRYDAGIAYVDTQLAPLLTELATPAHAARTLIVITADHGESLLEQEQRLFSHDPYLLSAVTRVPLFVRYPNGDGAGTVRADAVSLIDVAPTVLAVLGIDAPPTFDGRSLLELERGTRWPDRTIRQECWGHERLAAVRSSRWLAVRDLARSTTRLYDLREDPNELEPLDPSQRRAAAAIVKELDAFAARRPADESPSDLDPELVRRLRELGYVGDDPLDPV